MPVEIDHPVDLEIFIPKAQNDATVQDCGWQSSSSTDKSAPVFDEMSQASDRWLMSTWLLSQLRCRQAVVVGYCARVYYLS